jgi:hypothetical protein
MKAEALATMTVDDVNKALQTMLLEENSAYNPDRPEGTEV